MTPLLPRLFGELSVMMIMVKPKQPGPIDTMSIEKQADDLWCWSAVTLAIAKRYEPQKVMNQCYIASLVKEHKCCQGSNPVDCQSPHPIEDAVRKSGHLSGAPAPMGTFWDVVDAECNNKDGRPLACKMAGWVANDGTLIAAHAVVVRGSMISGSRRFFRVLDPWGPSSKKREAADFEKRLVGYFRTALKGVE
jgi:hypothetical protein